MIFVLALALLPVLLRPDPSPGLTTSRTRSRSFDCETVGASDAHRRYPDQIAPPPPRRADVEHLTVVCRERWMRPGLRVARDEAVLSTLSAQAAELTAPLEALPTALRARNWLVDAHVPSAPVAGKVRFAVQDALASRGLQVSDRTPILTAGDVDVITRMPPDAAFPAACQRYEGNHSLGPGDALLAVVLRDPRETLLHAGICVDGRWTWLR